jgi:hypothetical protein
MSETRGEAKVEWGGHTPGPWVVVEPSDGDMDTGLCILCEDLPGRPVFRLVAEVLSESQQADARLIAAAPELLEAGMDAECALDSLLAILDETIFEGDSRLVMAEIAECRAHRDALAAAIAKALPATPES